MLSNLSNHFNKIIVVKMNEENSITEDLLPKYLKLYFANSLTDSFKMINKLKDKIKKRIWDVNSIHYS